MASERRAPFYDEDDVLNAYLEVDGGRLSSRTAQKWGIPRSVIFD